MKPEELKEHLKSQHLALGHKYSPKYGWDKKLPPVRVKPKDTPEFRAAVASDIEIVRRNMVALEESAAAINRLKASRCYWLLDMDWKTFCAVTFGCTVSTIERISVAGNTKAELMRDPAMSKYVNIGNISPGPGDSLAILTSQEQMLAIANVPKEDRPEVVEKAYKAVGNKVTAKTIDFMAAQVAASKPKNKPNKPEAVGELPGSVRTALAQCEEWESIASKIKTLCTNWDRLINSPSGIHVPPGQLTDQIRRIVETLCLARPYSDCVYCGGLGGTIGDCKPCKGSGYITKATFDSAPPELRDKSKVRQ